MPDKLFVLSVVWANDTMLIGAFTSAEKLCDYTKRHTAAEVSSIPMAEYQEPLVVSVDPE